MYVLVRCLSPSANKEPSRIAYPAHIEAPGIKNSQDALVITEQDSQVFAEGCCVQALAALHASITTAMVCAAPVLTSRDLSFSSIFSFMVTVYV